jgi:hypothetical protein
VYSLEAHERIQPYVTLHRASIQPAHPQAESERERWGGGGGGGEERETRPIRIRLRRIRRPALIAGGGERGGGQ